MLLTLCLTHDCNLQCAYCYAGRKYKHAMNNHTAERAVELGLSEAVRTPNPSLTLRFFGGEPLIEWETLTWSVGHTADRCRELGVDLKLAVTTNGTLLSDSRLNWIQSRGIHIGLSMDGNPAMHDLLRRFKNGRRSHDRCLRSLRSIQERPKLSYEVILVPDPRNVQHLADSVRWLVSEGVSEINVNPNFYIDWTDEARQVWEEQYKEMGEFYLESYRRGEAIRINVIDGKIKTGISGGYKQCDTCSFGENEIAVAPSGNIYPCERLVADDTNMDVCIGNVFTGFDEEKRHEIVANRKPANPQCIGCSYRSRCMNWCCCINYATTGRTDSVHDVVCFHEQLAISVADVAGGRLFEEANPIFLEKFYPTHLTTDNGSDPSV